MARQKGVKVGMHRLVVAWPFPEKRVQELARKAKAIVVVEMNLGQMVREVERVVKGTCPVVLCGHAGGNVHDPKDIAEAIVSARSEKRPRDAFGGVEVQQ
jgi:2-oxoglutarate ferredoxin oxidoreductase subunit alpha